MASRAAPVASVRDALAAAEDSLRAAGCDTPRLDAELLLAHALGVSRESLFLEPGSGVPPAAARRAMELVRRRVAREPVAYILGVKGFRHIDLAVDRRVLIPRPETELLVELALPLPAGARVHDVGTGSGAIALALEQERPDLEVSASDAVPGAVAVARANAARLGLDVRVEEATGLPGGAFDLVLANLPYVREDEWAGLAPEITRWEPREALVSGADGLDAIRSLAASAPSGTLLALEHAPAQAAAVRELLREAHSHHDLAGRERTTVGRAP
ncbi:MAG TPA: peptide chain release factor N(5)-glutamine methyltransferase [Thermoleophilaceae bacterium]|nr:peptide chain release factor N(5)-glutamine methyltransferase [Thermoleophilaceae bacterium]